MALAIPNELEKLRAGAKRFADEFTVGQKTVVGITFLAIVVSVIAFLHYSSKPSYAPLYTNLTQADASTITQKLQSANIPFELADNGTTVMVPSKDVYSERIALAQQGLPSQNTNVGLSKVDKEGITTSAFQQQVDFQQGLQGELQTTIEAISGVQTAQVNLVLPSDNPLALNNSPGPSAAVLVTTANGATLNDGQVQAIVHLVASSVPGLNASDVTVTDSQGDLLAGPGATQGSLQQQNGQTKLYENGVIQQVNAVLTPVLGPNHAIVTDHAELNFDQDNKVINGLVTNPDGTVQSAPNQSNQQNSNFTGNGVVQPGGTAGQIITSQVGNGNGTSTLTTQGVQQNFTIGKYTESIQKAPGAITDQNVAVVVDRNILNKEGISVDNISQLVSTAAGVNQARGDVVTVQALPFSTQVASAQAQAQNAANAAAHRRAVMNVLKAVGIALAILLILLIMHFSSRKPEEILPEELPELEAGEEYYEPEEELMMGEEQPEMMPAEAGMPNPFDIDLAEGIPHELETSSIGEFIENQPDEVARLLRAWMTEQKIPGIASREGQPA